MKKITAFLSAMLLVTSAFAQADKDFKAVLDKALAQFEKGGVEISGVVHWGSDGAFTLSIKMDHERFYGDVADFAVWFDGKTQWFLRSEEIYISEPAADELQYANPYLLMKNADKQFDIRKIDAAQLPKGAAAGVQLTPRSYSELQSVKVFFDKESRPVSLKAFFQNGNNADVDILSFKNGLKFKTEDFTCNTKDYDADVIDMR